MWEQYFWSWLFWVCLWIALTAYLAIAEVFLF